VPVESLGVPTQFIPHDKPDAILARFGLNADGIVAAVRGLLS
jgi:deoxyxylulose-5-phosphate synthase